MPNKLRCKVCQEYHNAELEHFPLITHEKRANKKGEVKDFITGYICLKCARKGLKEQARMEDFHCNHHYSNYSILDNIIISIIWVIILVAMVHPVACFFKKGV